jgi:glutathione synthetase
MQSSLLKVDEEKLDEYELMARDASLYAGLAYFCAKDKNDPAFKKIAFHPFTLLPVPFPRREFNLAAELQLEWNKLLHLCSNDYQFLHDCFKEIKDHDEFVRKIWHIYDQVYHERVSQPIYMSVHRLDYMLDAEKNSAPNCGDTRMSQVEINTFCCGGCAVPSRLVQLYKYMLIKTDNQNFLENLAENRIESNTVNCLLTAWKLYQNPKAAIVMLVRNTKCIYSDHRLTEYMLYQMEPSVKFMRLTYQDVHRLGKLNDKKQLFINDFEVGLVFFKSGFDPNDYPTENEWSARLLIERSTAIKAPKIAYQLLSMKRFQQYLSEPGVLERFVENEKTLKLIRDTFVPIYAFGKEKDNEKLIRKMKTEYEDLILKPQRDGGGNNLYQEEIRKLAETIGDETELYKFTLMKRIKEVLHECFVSSNEKPLEKIFASTEIGFNGLTIGDSSDKLLLNEFGGFSVAVKKEHANEGGIMAGSGSFSTIFLTD